jgi:hypothetical protein
MKLRKGFLVDELCRKRQHLEGSAILFSLPPLSQHEHHLSIRSFNLENPLPVTVSSPDTTQFISEASFHHAAYRSKAQ